MRIVSQSDTIWKISGPRHQDRNSPWYRRQDLFQPGEFSSYEEEPYYVRMLHPDDVQKLHNERFYFKKGRDVFEQRSPSGRVHTICPSEDGSGRCSYWYQNHEMEDVGVEEWDRRHQGGLTVDQAIESARRMEGG